MCSKKCFESEIRSAASLVGDSVGQGGKWGQAVKMIFPDSMDGTRV